MTSDRESATKALAGYLVAPGSADMPAGVRKEAHRGFLNWIGCALGGSRHPAARRAFAALAPFAGPAKASLLGHSERTDPLLAALVNGIASHVLDFDDTHLATVIHPMGPVASAALALAEAKGGVSGKELVTALVLGVEAECRIGLSVFPEHYDRGWHITGTAGVFGAAAAAGRLLGLDAPSMLHALGLAATQPVGLRVMFGSMAKSFHPGSAAASGLQAALLAQAGFTAAEDAIEGRRGWAEIMSTHFEPSQITKDLGRHFESSANTYKPFACGIVIHPVIDACLRLRAAHTLRPEEISAVEVAVHPLVLELTGKTSPATGLESKFSVFHAAAVALIRGRAGNAEFSDEAVMDPQVLALRARVEAHVDQDLAPDAAVVVLRTADGRRLEERVEHAIGSQLRPMSDEAIAEKVTTLAAEILPASRIDELVALCWKIEEVTDISAIVGLARPA